jgi:glycolate oxidase FAD binding subunit
MRGPDITARIAQAREARWFYDWGGGLIWLATPADGDAGAADIRAAMQATGGHATLVRAPDEVRAAIDVFEPLSPTIMAITRNLKATFDPAGILNPGRMYAEI